METNIPKKYSYDDELLFRARIPKSVHPSIFKKSKEKSFDDVVSLDGFTTPHPVCGREGLRG